MTNHLRPLCLIAAVALLAGCAAQAVHPPVTPAPLFTGPKNKVDITVFFDDEGCVTSTQTSEASCPGAGAGNDPTDVACQRADKGSGVRKIAWVSDDGTEFKLDFGGDNPFKPMGNPMCTYTTLGTEIECKIKNWNDATLKFEYKYDVITDACTLDPKVYLMR